MDVNERLFSRHLDEDEELVAVIHQHWLLGLKHMVWPTLMFLAGWGVLFFFPFRFLFFVVAVWAIVWLVWWLRDFYDYYLDAWVITDQGIIDVEWHGWFHRTSTRVLFSDVQGVSYEIKGVIGTVLRYGTITVEKISTGEDLALPNVPTPRGVEQLILKTMEEYLHGKNLTDAKHVQEILSQLVAEQMQLRELEDGGGGEPEEGAEGEDDGEHSVPAEDE